MCPGFFLTAAGCSYGGQRFDISFEAGSDALAQLQAIIAEADVASCNGINVQTMGVPECGGSISVKCASGERIYAYDNATVPFPSVVAEPLCAMFEELTAEAGTPLLPGRRGQGRAFPSSLSAESGIFPGRSCIFPQKCYDTVC